MDACRTQLLPNFVITINFISSLMTFFSTNHKKLIYLFFFVLFRCGVVYKLWRGFEGRGTGFVFFCFYKIPIKNNDGYFWESLRFFNKIIFEIFNRFLKSRAIVEKFWNISNLIIFNKFCILISFILAHSDWKCDKECF